ncbi:hypothetical protein AC622_11165 [Bacillus sp. FJAT-27916]|uniref:DnaA N-terminal domain-containing protein n=1 Tax=Bacillus sp. FJAT-27916 TaxID=1679169 RepID=UPI00067164B9|nr:DnaA N-terminal domain-containing protein [Bacillus sp. FJAT-27916]KMY44718.1 hypothetical protein AC622_11165 [Bacillus sp. FJAT-27916]
MLTEKERSILKMNKEVLLSLLQMEEVRVAFKMLVEYSTLPEKEQILFYLDAGEYRLALDSISQFIDQAEQEKENGEAATDRDLWNQILKKVAEQLSEPSFNTWFKGTSLYAQEGDVLYVTASNSFARDWLEERYTEMANQAIASLGLPYTVRFIANEN